jgi:hypothetical protein
MKSLLNSTFASLLFVTLCAFPCTSSAEKNPMRDFPSEFKFSELWEQLVIDGKPTRAYRFVTNETIDEVKVKVSRWLQQSQVPVVERTKNGWTYLSYRNDDTWITVQVRLYANGGSSKVEGLVSFWQASNQLAVRGLEPRLSTLSSMQVLRRLESIDRGRNAITVTAISDASVEVVANGLSADMKTHGYVPASYAPPSLLSGDKAANLYGAISRAWIGNGQQVLFSVFEHRGKTAAQIYVLGGKHLE